VQVRVGTEGVHAVLARPDGTPATLETLFPGRWSPWRICLAIVIAVAAALLLACRRASARPVPTSSA